MSLKNLSEMICRSIQRGKILSVLSNSDVKKNLFTQIMRCAKMQKLFVLISSRIFPFTKFYACTILSLKTIKSRKKPYFYYCHRCAFQFHFSETS